MALETIDSLRPLFKRLTQINRSRLSTGHNDTKTTRADTCASTKAAGARTKTANARIRARPKASGAHANTGTCPQTADPRVTMSSLK
jgi:hypothetical protein